MNSYTRTAIALAAGPELAESLVSNGHRYCRTCANTRRNAARTAKRVAA